MRRDGRARGSVFRRTCTSNGARNNRLMSGRGRYIVAVEFARTDFVYRLATCANKEGGMSALPKPVSPALAPIFGTPGNDTLAATAEGQALFGRAGHDTLSSLYDDTALHGGAVHDALSILLDLSVWEGVPVFDVAAAAFGGAGEDTISIDIMVYTDVPPADFSIFVDGGAGSDQIDVSTVSDAFGDSVVTNTIRGGSGNDRISALAIGGNFFGNFSTAINEIWGGTGNDHVTARAVVYSNTSLLASNYLDGGAGHDYLFAS